MTDGAAIHQPELVFGVFFSSVVSPAVSDSKRKEAAAAVAAEWKRGQKERIPESN